MDMPAISMSTTNVCAMFDLCTYLVLILPSFHIVMNLSHVITEFSFGPYFPDMTQPLDNSFELTDARE